MLVHVYTDPNVLLHTPLRGWRWFLHLLTLRQLSPTWLGARRMVVALGDGTYLCHPDNYPDLESYLTDCGYIVRRLAFKPNLRVIRNDGKKDT